jgi:pimeloyl-ACP methyl ester carboxylesterase
MAASGGLPGALDTMLTNKPFYRSAEALGAAYEHPDRVSDETIETYLLPHRASAQRTRDLERFLAAFDCAQTVAIEPQLKSLRVPTLIAWGTDDIYFDVQWSHWLARTIPGSKRRVDIAGGRIFFPEERAAEFNAELRTFWSESS